MSGSRESTPADATPSSSFDAFAGDYDEALNRGISLSGESKDYFIDGRIAWFRRCLGGEAERSAGCGILDYGCGVGSSFAKLRDAFGAQRVIGVDVSTAELAIARKDYPWATVHTPEQVPTDLAVDFAYTNGTFHHIPPPQRLAAMQLIFRSLKPGGYFAFWENNPWNPGTRWVMKRIPFDRDAITLSALESRGLARQAGFKLLRTDFMFIFPRMLAALRGLEPLVSRLPLGSQYQVLCQKP